MKNQKLHILIVDDDRRMTHTLSDILALEGFSTSQAFSGQEAIAQVRSTHFDCVLADIRMPGMNGIELHNALRAIRDDLPVILMTAYAGEQLINQGLEDGVIGVLEKPLDIHHLLAFLSTLDDLCTLVLVDDDPSFSATLADILERRGYRVCRPVDAAQDIREMIAGSQVVVLDARLDQQGVDVLRRIRRQNPSTPVVLITGYRSQLSQALQHAQELDVFACLYKPLAIPDLLEVISKIRTSQLRTRLLR